jgi:hypothetical protein
MLQQQQLFNYSKVITAIKTLAKVRVAEAALVV